MKKEDDVLIVFEFSLVLIGPGRNNKVFVAACFPVWQQFSGMDLDPADFRLKPARPEQDSHGHIRLKPYAGAISQMPPL